MHCEDISGNTIKDQYEWAQSYLTQWQRKTNKKGIHKDLFNDMYR